MLEQPAFGEGRAGVYTLDGRDVTDQVRPRKPLGVSVDPYGSMLRPPELAPFAPDATTEVLLAGLVACGRALGRIDRELGARMHWQTVLSQASRLLPPTAGVETPQADWASVGRLLFDLVKATAEAPQSEPERPIRERAEALAILIMQGRKTDAPPNVLIRAGAVLEVLRGLWRKARAGQS